MNLVIPDSIASRQDLSAVTREIHTYAAWASRELIKQKVVGKAAGTQPAISQEANAVLRSWMYGKPMTKTKLDELTKALEIYARTAPSVTITLAGVPAGETKTKLVAWCRRELRPNILVSFRLNRAILGGMVVAYGSHIHDWSFRRKLLETTTSFSQVLERV